VKLHSFVRCFVVAVTLLQTMKSLTAQSADPLLNRLRSSATASALTREGVGPFYLKIDVQLYDAKGKPGEKGTIEDWWAGNDTEKTVFSLPSYSSTRVRKGDVVFSKAGATYVPDVLKLLLNQVIDPLPAWTYGEGVQANLRPIKFGTVPLECIVLNLKKDPKGVPVEYCLDPGKDSLRLTYQYENRMTIRNRLGTFQGKQVPVDVTVRNGELMGATGHISSLMSRGIAESEISTDGLTDKTVLSTPVDVELHAIKRNPPIYPEAAKRQHLSGLVVLQAMIGTDGHIHDLGLVSSPSPILTSAAEDAVKDWTYKPLEVDGVATAGETTILVTFRFG
jgi:TonB family protein